VILGEGVDVVDRKTQNIVYSGECIDGMRMARFKRTHHVANIGKVDVKDEWTLTHWRLGHPSDAVISKMVDSQLISGVSKRDAVANETSVCKGCALGKMTRAKVPKHTKNHRFDAKEPAAKLHLDTVGPFVKSIDGYKGFGLVSCDVTKYKWALMYKKKSDVAQALIDLMKKIELQTDYKIKVLHSDNGGEFDCNLLHRFVRDNGLVFEWSEQRTPEQNGSAERQNRVVLEKAWSMIHGSGLSKSFWPEAVETAVFLSNRTWTKAIQTSPYEKFWNKKPDLSMLKVFGARGFGMIDRKTKDQPKSEPLIFLGYEKDRRSYTVYWTKRKKLGNCRSIQVDEFKLLRNSQAQDDIEVVMDNNLKKKSRVKSVHVVDGSGGFAVDVTDDYSPSTDDKDDEDDSQPRIISKEAERLQDALTVTNLPKKRIKKKVVRLGLAAKVSKLTVPKNFDEIATREDAQEWMLAYQKEVTSLEDVAGMKLVPLDQVPKTTQVIPIRELFSRKIDSITGAEVLKVRIVARGDLQKEKDHELYSPVASMESVRIMIGMSARENWVIRQADVSTAFLYGRNSSEIFLKLPCGHRDYGKCAWKTNASIYGINSAPKTWNSTIHSFLEDEGFEFSEIDGCLYKKSLGNRELYLVLYVDDLLYCSSDLKLLDEFERKIATKFKLKFTDDVSKFLGMNLRRDNHVVYLSQKDKIDKLVHVLELENAKCVWTPMVNTKWDEERSQVLEDPKLFQSIVGQLLYLNMCSRGDITFVVNVLSRYMKEPRFNHLNLAKRVVKYLKTTRDLEMKFTGEQFNDEVDFICFTDSSYCSEDDLTSVIGFVIFVGDNIVKYRSKKLKFIAESSCEAEFMAVYFASKEIRAVMNVLDFLGVRYKRPKVWCDNQSTIKIARSAASVERTKHIKRKYLKIRELIRNGILEIDYVETTQQVADIFTKALPRPQFEFLRENLNSGGSVEKLQE
jgi:hypothetical protein